MNYDQIILELLGRIQVLEQKVAVLEGKQVNNGELIKENAYQPYSKEKGLTQRARDYISNLIEKAKEEGQTEIVLVCNDIQKALGIVNRPRCICDAMYGFKKDNDIILKAPPSGYSTTLTIKYFIQ